MFVQIQKLYFRLTQARLESDRSANPWARGLFASSLLLLLVGLAGPAQATGESGNLFKRIPLQYIAALGDPEATSGNGAEKWGLWRLDPGPRGVRLASFDLILADGGVAPAQWKFDDNDWWLEENGLIMESPDFPLAPGKYVVTGDRETIAILTVFPDDADGNRRWELDRGANLHDVTHLGCRSARYTPSAGQNSCSPRDAPQSVFRITPGEAMPPVKGCDKQDYAVLFVIGMGLESQ